MKGGGRRRLGTRHVQMLRNSPGVWQVTVDLKQELGGTCSAEVKNCR